MGSTATITPPIDNLERLDAVRQEALAQTRLSNAISAFFTELKAAEDKLGRNPSRDALWRVWDRIEPLHADKISNLRKDLAQACRNLACHGVE